MRVPQNTVAPSLLALIGAGCHRLSEIGSRVGQPATNLSRPLSRLIDLGYVRRELPFGESTRSTKRSLYRLDDPFLLFWYQMARDSVVRIALHGMRWNPASRWWVLRCAPKGGVREYRMR